MNKLHLIPQFIDRAGRTVFNIHIGSGRGEIIGQIRLKQDDESVILEWVSAGEETQDED